MPLLRESFPVGALGCNCTIVACPDTRQALVVDPGDEAPAILDRLARLGVTAVKLVHTHAHFDHIFSSLKPVCLTPLFVDPAPPHHYHCSAAPLLPQHHSQLTISW